MFLEILSVYNKRTNRKEYSMVHEGFWVSDFALENNAPFTMKHLGSSEEIDLEEVVRKVSETIVNDERYFEIETDLRIYSTREKF